MSKLTPEVEKVIREHVAACVAALGCDTDCLCYARREEALLSEIDSLREQLKTAQSVEDWRPLIEARKRAEAAEAKLKMAIAALDEIVIATTSYATIQFAQKVLAAIQGEERKW